MDPDNLLRGPRRALRRGDAHALRYDRRIGQPDLGDAVHDRRTSTMLAVAMREVEEGRPTEEIMERVARRLHEWQGQEANAADLDVSVARGDHEDDGDDQLVDETSEEGGSGGEYNGYGERSLGSTNDDGDEDDEGGSLDPEAYGELAGDALMESGDVDGGEDGDVEEYEYDGTQQEEEMQDDEPGPVFDPLALGLKEINNLAHFSVSSHKPGSGVAELLSDDLTKYWQSDGPQPHLLTIHFLRRVEIRAIRFYVDYNQDESYTPTSVLLSAGTGHHDLQPFLMVAMTNPSGWQDVDLGNVGGGADGRSLCCWIVQIQVKENHQNGKDTHIRGIKLYAIDENAPPPPAPADAAAAHEPAQKRARATRIQHEYEQRQHHRNLLHSPLLHGSVPNLAYDPRNGPAQDEAEHLLEQLLARSPERVAGVLDGAGSMDNFLRDMEIR